MISRDDLHTIMPRAPGSAIVPLNAAMAEFGITTRPCAAAWLAQIAHESSQLRQLEENLNYSAHGLQATWPSRFVTEVEAEACARQPARIANRVYADRMGNGDEASGDGWKYRGRGLIQITGKANYAGCSIALFGDARLIESPELLATMTNACRSAAWWWTAHGLNALADAGQFAAITRRINGGLNGQSERLAYWARARKTLGLPS